MRTVGRDATPDLAGKRVLVTGAASGIGRADGARGRRRKGAELFLTDIDEDALQDVAAEIRDGGGTVSFAKAARRLRLRRPCGALAGRDPRSATAASTSS